MTDLEKAIERVKFRKQMALDDMCQYYENIALQALQEKLEREQGCEHCNNSVETGSCDSNAKMRVEKGDIHCLPYIVVENDTFGTSDIFDADYCPNCGRKLKEDY